MSAKHRQTVPRDPCQQIPSFELRPPQLYVQCKMDSGDAMDVGTSVESLADDELARVREQSESGRS